ncbi:ScyD/ScyE family protein [Humibacillus sp. DSM 29435]|uniref:ScyD/ScyE family protein n=1 Tax=Humibacillus sp. DSM 29435 TaxID=1869167 RepID=UPI000A459F69|nr:ScyD/ScyE family protein [Humibacillus sp. DSM 29435]
MGKSRMLMAAVTAPALTTLGLVSAPNASASQSHTGPHWRGHTLTTEVLAPFQLAVNNKGVYIADGFKNNLSLLKKNGKLSLIAQGTGSDVAGVDVSKNGKSIAWTSTTMPMGPGERVESSLTIRTQGKKDVVADLAKYERTHNPDGHTTYGAIAGSNACADAVLGQISGGPARYRGLIDSHPYAVAAWGDSWIVADAAGNDLLRVDARGRVSTLAVLPRQPVKLTKAMAAALGAPDCVVGVTYAFEPVPTDVEVDYRGNLVVSTLPGGPEDPSLGARGSVYTVNAHTGKAARLATGFLGATNVAIGPDGVYVAELFAGKVTKVKWNGAKKTFAKVANAISLEVRGGWLYAGTLGDVDLETGQVNGPGTVQRFWIL